MARDIRYKVAETLKDVVSSTLVGVLVDEDFTCEVTSEAALSIDVKIGKGKGSPARKFRIALKEQG